MAKLIINADLTVLSAKVVKTLANRSCGTEDIASRCCSTRDSVRAYLAKLKAKGVVQHDGRRPRTWALVDGAVIGRQESRSRAQPRSFEPWEDALILEMLAEGARHTQIGQKIGRRRDSVKCRVAVLQRRYETEAA